MKLTAVLQQQRQPSPTITPQALTWDGEHLWMGSRDLHRIYKLSPAEWKVLEEIDPPGIPWAAVSANGSVYFTIGEGPDDDRYIYRYTGGEAFEKLFACPELTGSYLSHDGQNLYLSQWYKKRILQLDDSGNIKREIDVDAEICGHTYLDGDIYVLRGRERPTEEWRIARLSLAEAIPVVEDLATVPFAARSLAFDGNCFWSNHRAANETIAFSLPH